MDKPYRFIDSCLILNLQGCKMPMSIEYSIKKNILNNDSLVLKKIREIYNMLNFSFSIFSKLILFMNKFL
jgi:hypothetical protein